MPPCPGPVSSEDPCLPWRRPFSQPTNVRKRKRKPVRETMVQLIIQERHFLLLFVRKTSAQRKVLLQTITRHQLRALSQIAYNIVKSKTALTPIETATLSVTDDSCISWETEHWVINIKKKPFEINKGSSISF